MPYPYNIDTYPTYPVGTTHAFDILLDTVLHRFNPDRYAPIVPTFHFDSERCYRLHNTFYEQNNLTLTEYYAAKILLFCLQNNKQLTENQHQLSTLVEYYSQTLQDQSQQNQYHENTLPKLTLTGIGLVALGVNLYYKTLEGDNYLDFSEKKQRFNDMKNAWDNKKHQQFLQKNKENIHNPQLQPAIISDCSLSQIIIALTTMLNKRSGFRYVLGGRPLASTLFIGKTRNPLERNPTSDQPPAKKSRPVTSGIVNQPH